MSGIHFYIEDAKDLQNHLVQNKDQKSSKIIRQQWLISTYKEKSGASTIVSLMLKCLSWR